MGKTSFSGPINSRAGFLIDDVPLDLPGTGDPGPGISSGTGTIVESSAHRFGNIIVTRILVDLTGTTSADTDLDVIGVASQGAAYIGRIDADSHGTIFGGLMTCLEVPSSLTDVDLYASPEGNNAAGDLITADTGETALVTAGGAWTLGAIKGLSGLPGDGDYLYFTNGAADTPDPFTAGKFLIELYGLAS